METYILVILISDKPTTQHGGGDVYGDLDLVPESMNRVGHTKPPRTVPDQHNLSKQRSYTSHDQSKKVKGG